MPPEAPPSAAPTERKEETAQSPRRRPCGPTGGGPPGLAGACAAVGLPLTTSYLRSVGLYETVLFSGLAARSNGRLVLEIHL